VVFEELDEALADHAGRAEDPYFDGGVFHGVYSRRPFSVQECELKHIYN
jgi:hypothetical protein